MRGEPTVLQQNAPLVLINAFSQTHRKNAEHCVQGMACCDHVRSLFGARFAVPRLAELVARFRKPPLTRVLGCCIS